MLEKPTGIMSIPEAAYLKHEALLCFNGRINRQIATILTAEAMSDAEEEEDNSYLRKQLHELNEQYNLYLNYSPTVISQSGEIQLKLRKISSIR